MDVKLNAWATVEIPMDESPWKIRLTQEENGVSVALHWNDKPTPTHETFVSSDEFKKLAELMLRGI